MKKSLLLIFLSILSIGFVFAECTDTDGGKNYDVAGRTTINGVGSPSTSSGWDMCLEKEGSSLKLAIGPCSGENCIQREHYCVGDTVHTSDYVCPYGCGGGACLSSPPCEDDIKKCPDGSTVKRIYPSCEFEECYVEQCHDSDGGKNYYKKGVVEASNMPSGIKDNCAFGNEGNPDSINDKNLLFEAYCFEEEFGYGFDFYSCPYGCENGACKAFIDETEDLVIPIEEFEESSKSCPEKSCTLKSEKCIGTNKVITEECNLFINKDDRCEQITTTSSKIINDVCEIEADDQIICQGCTLNEKTCVPFGIRIEKNNISYYCDVANQMTQQKKNKDYCQNSFECLSNNCKDSICKPICEGCLNENNICLPIGTRSGDEYCNSDYIFGNQKSEESSCNNNFECSSNVCINNECISEGLIKKILNWFKSLFT